MPDISSYLGFNHAGCIYSWRPLKFEDSSATSAAAVGTFGMWRERVAGQNSLMSEWEIEACEDTPWSGMRIRDCWTLLLSWREEQHKTNSLRREQQQTPGKYCKVIGIQKVLEAMANLSLTSKHIWPGTWRCDNIKEIKFNMRQGSITAQERIGNNRGEQWESKYGMLIREIKNKWDMHHKLQHFLNLPFLKNAKWVGWGFFVVLS